MSDSTEPLLDGLRGQHPPAPFAEPDSVRRRGRQRARRQRLSVGLALLVVIGGGTTSLVDLAGETAPPPPAASPSTAATVVPRTWLLSAGDLGGAGWWEDSNELFEGGDPPWYWTDLCPDFQGYDYASLRHRVALNTVSWVNDTGPTTIRLDQVVASFDSVDGARVNLHDVLTVIDRCGRAAPPSGVAPTVYEVVDTGFGDTDSLLVQRDAYFFVGEEVAEHPDVSYLAVVRSGAAVTTLISEDEELVRKLTPVAVAKLE